MPTANPGRQKTSPIPYDLQPAMFRLADMCEESIKADYESGSAMLHGTRDLIAHHPGLREYHEALNWIVEGEIALNRLCCNRLIDPSAAERMPPVLARMADLYDDAREKNLEEGINRLIAAGDLIAHHPDLSEYRRAIGWLADGYSVLIEMCREVRAL